MDVHVEIDTRELEAGIKAAMEYSDRTLPAIVNNCLFWIAYNARKDTPRVEMARVDQELGVLAVPVIGKRGQETKKKTFQAVETVSVQTKGGGSKEVPLAALIVAARANKGSRYNKLTHGRYELDENPFAGVSREAGRSAMRQLIDKMTKARHRSGGFLKAGYNAALWMLRGKIDEKLMAVSAAEQAGVSINELRIGNAEPAVAGDDIRGSLENNVGMEGINRESFNAALHRIGGPILQEAVDNEGQKQAEYALKKYEEGLMNVTRPHWG